MSDIQEKILRTCNSIPVPNLLGYVNRGLVSIKDLRVAGLTADKAQALVQLRKTEDQNAWAQAEQANTAEAFQQYLQSHAGGGMHAADARLRLSGFDEQAWLSVKGALSEEALRSYQQQFPEGAHTAECQEMLADLPWLKAQSGGTLQDYQDYMAAHPGQHTAEAEQAINALLDDIDWEHACQTHTKASYEAYARKHPAGKHTHDAQLRIDAAAGREAFLAALRDDANAYGAHEITEKVKNCVASWDDIRAIFGPDRTRAIQDYVQPADLPVKEAPEQLTPGRTEVYFWGTPSSGKTCALGSVISSAKLHGFFTPEDCSGRDYMTRLSNIFNPSGYCVFPQSTSIGNIQEMSMTLTDEKRAKHSITLIDMAGELFRSAYFKQNGLFLSQDAEQTLDTALGYLASRENQKIHFFVVEYGAHDRTWDELRMGDYLDNMVLYLKNQKIFRKSTVGVYILVTKCDKIPCAPEERPRMAFDYVQTHLLSFYNTLSDICAEAGVRDLTVLAFSVGEVFAQNLCAFDTTDTDKVVSKLFAKTRAEKKGFLSKLRS